MKKSCVRPQVSSFDASPGGGPSGQVTSRRGSREACRGGWASELGPAGGGGCHRFTSVPGLSRVLPRPPCHPNPLKETLQPRVPAPSPPRLVRPRLRPRSSAQPPRDTVHTRGHLALGPADITVPRITLRLLTGSAHADPPPSPQEPLPPTSPWSTLAQLVVWNPGAEAQCQPTRFHLLGSRAWSQPGRP